MTTLTVNIDEDLLHRIQQIAAARGITVDDLVSDALQEMCQRWSE